MLKAYKDAIDSVKFKKKMVANVKDKKHVKLKLMSRAQKKEQRCIAKEMRKCNAAVKAVEKDERLNKPLTAFWLWLKEDRENVATQVGGKGSEVAKKAGETWRTLLEEQKAPYEEQAKKLKSAYHEYLGTLEGAEALKAYKVKTAAVAYDEKAVEADAEEPVRKKRRLMKAGVSSPTTPKTKPIPKKCAKRGRKAAVKAVKRDTENAVEAEEEPFQKKQRPAKAGVSPPTTPKNKRVGKKCETAEKLKSATNTEDMAEKVFSL